MRALMVPDRNVRFTIAIIALGAKLSKVDGQVTREEIDVFRGIFRIPGKEHNNAARIFNYASQTAIGYEYYAMQIARVFGTGNVVLEDIMEGLIAIACSDGKLSYVEKQFLVRVNRIFGLREENLRARLRFAANGTCDDPYCILGIDRNASIDEIRTAWKTKVMQTHPDILTSLGIPKEAMKISENRLRIYNQAWDLIRSERLAISA